MVTHIIKRSLLTVVLLSSTFVYAIGVQPNIELELLTSPVPFFSMMDDHTTLDGYSIDLNKAILKNAGYQAKVESLPWARVLKRSENNRLSVISALVRTPERENAFFWITPISVNAVAIYTLDTVNHKIESIEDVSQLGSIAVLRDDYRHQILRDKHADTTIAFNQWSVAIRSLLKGRTKSLFFSDMGLILTCIDSQLDCSSIKRVFTYKKSVSYLALKKSDDLVPVSNALKASAEEFKTSLAFKELVSRYLNSEHPAANYLEVNDGVIGVSAQ